MTKFDSMWFFQKISFAMMLMNNIILALGDKKLTLEEIVNLVNIILGAVAEDISLKVDDIRVFAKQDGRVMIELSPELVSKLNISL